MSLPARNRRRPYASAIILIICLGSISAGYSAIQRWPDLSGHAADLLRGIFGDQVVAALETTIFQAQDRVNNLTYHVGAAPPAAPWDAAPPMTTDAPVSPAQTPSTVT